MASPPRLSFWLRLLLLGVLATLVAGACGSEPSSEVLGQVQTGGEDTATSADDAAPDAGDTGADLEGQYQAEAAEFDQAAFDRSVPDEPPETATGVFGYSRYVFLDTGSEIVPTLVEGPRGRQIRCQDVERDCSRNELQALFDSGDELPDYLAMSRDELRDLLDELGETEDAVNRHPTLEAACAAGFQIQSSQNPNMGIHAVNPDGTTEEFDPGRPQMVLYAKDGGEKFSRAEVGDCVDGQWTGESGYESVGAAFTLNITDDHPDAFTGPIDNWHIHYNSCVGSPEEGGSAVAEDPTQFLGDRNACESRGGVFNEIIPVWMVHAYVDRDFDSQGGVFAMFNPSIAPVSDSAEIAERWTEPVEGGIAAPINNFDFGDIRIQAGETVVFSNSDSVPHTVTGGRPGSPETASESGGFDSGVFGTGQSFQHTFDEAGSYPLFCVLHPGMTATVTVE